MVVAGDFEVAAETKYSAQYDNTIFALQDVDNAD